jgi:glycosyltransferase involved in cell wall biosynthesis
MKKKIFFLEGNVDGTVGGSYYLMYDLVLALDRDKFEPVVGFHTDNFLVPKLREAGIETVILEVPEPFSFGTPILDRVLRPLKVIVNVCKRFVLHGVKLSRFLKQNEFDLVNLNNSIMRNHSWMLAAMLSGTKCMTHEMGINDRFSFLSRFFGKRLESIICLSYAIRDNMFELGVNYPNITVIHCGIDPDRYQIVEQPAELRKKHGIDDTARVIGVVGNIKYWKGQETIVRAMAALTDEYPDLVCVLVGGTSEADIDYLNRQKAICDETGIADSVIFAGFQKNAIDYMNLMDIVVHTSVAPEPFGIVTLEALSLSKPYISTTIGGPAEVIEDGKSGLLVDPGKPELLADALRRFLANPDFARECGINGEKRLRSDFTFEKNVNETIAVYERILEIQ